MKAISLGIALCLVFSTSAFAGSPAPAKPAEGESGTVLTTGFRFTKIEPGSIYDRLGLKEGDTILSINGKPVNTPAELKQIFQKLGTKGNSTYKIDIERAGKKETLNYNVKSE